MATLLQVDRILYVFDVDTQDSQSLSRLYFCIYCLGLRSSHNLLHEDDSHFCPQALDSLASAEAVSRKNKCSNSWRCPACLHTLSTRATSTISPPTTDSNKPTVKTVYYQSCTFCRWSTRSVGIDDKEVANDAWMEKTNPSLPRINKLLEYYKYLEHKEKVEQARKSPMKKELMSVTMQLKQKYTSTKHSPAKKSMFGDSLSGALSSLRLKDVSSLKDISIDASSTLALDEVEKLNTDIYKPVQFTAMTSAAQRLDQPGNQIIECSDFAPRRSQMFMKQSLRCKICDHNIIKPEYSPTSIKFKIHLIALNHIPEIRISKPSKLCAGERCQFVLSITNPTEHVIHATFLPMEETKHRINAKIELPTCDIVVGKFDDAAEFVDQLASTNNTDDTSIIAFRRGNKVGFYVHCTPDPTLPLGGNVWVGLRFKHEHYGSAPLALLLKGGEVEKEPEPNWLTHSLFINLGKIQSSLE
ncbi:dynactin subunit 4 [Ciona intestinalis]